jgi:hypothetical protein
MSAPAAVSRPIPARVLDLLLERRFAPFHGVSRRREYAVQFGWINLPIAGLESACPQDRHGAERCQHRIQHLVRLMGRARALEARYTEPEKDLLLLRPACAGPRGTPFPLARLHQLRGLGDAKVLKSLGHSPKGRHYRG